MQFTARYQYLTHCYLSLHLTTFGTAYFRCDVTTLATSCLSCEKIWKSGTTAAVLIIRTSGKTYMMLGVDDSPMNLGIIPSAITWLYRLVDERRRTTGARFSVRVSAVEVTGRQETIKDLLANATTGELYLSIGGSQHQRSAMIKENL